MEINKLFILFIFVCINNCCCSTTTTTENIENRNETRARIIRHNFEDGLGRFIKFNTNSNDKMMINLEFSVPFITVPLRQDNPHLPPTPVEINVRGILLAAGLGAVASIVVPALTGMPGPFSAFAPATHVEPPPLQSPLNPLHNNLWN